VGIPPGSHTLGPDNARLTIQTTKAGAASKAGHNLLMEVGSWQGTVADADGAEPQITLTADSRSIRVLEGTGGIKGLTEDDKKNISQTIDDEVLKGCPIEFRSTKVVPDGDQLQVQGELELAGRRNPITFSLSSDGAGRLAGSTIVKQTDWGMKPYSALFGTLKVGDEVTVVIDATLPSA
jgi:hypothetical protein